MCGRQDFRGIGVECAVVDVETETYEAGEGHVLGFCADLSVCEEEGHLRKDR
jgi:hypothetical protein